MPPLPDANKVVRVYLQYTIGTDTTNATRLFFQYAGSAPTPAALSNWCISIGNAWQAHMAQCSPPAVVLTQIRATDLSTTSAADALQNVTYPGTRTGGALPASACFLVNYTLNRRYRGGKPRSYLPCGTATDVASPQTWTAAFVGLVSAQWTQFLTTIVADVPPTGVGAVQHVNVSYYYTPPATPEVPHPPSQPRVTPQIDAIGGLIFDTNYGSQRRRVRG